MSDTNLRQPLRIARDVSPGNQDVKGMQDINVNAPQQQNTNAPIVNPPPPPSQDNNTADNTNTQQTDQNNQQTQQDNTADDTDLLAKFAEAKHNVLPEAPAVKKDDTQQTQQQNTQVQTQQQKPSTDGRDYSGFSEEETEHFKRMGNDAFNYLKPRFLASKKMQEELNNTKKSLEEAQKNTNKSGIPDSIYQHPDAYILTPEFRQAAEDVNKAQQVAEHWRQQSIAIAKGAKEVHGLALDGKGNLVLTGKVDATPEVEEEVRTLVSNSQFQLMQAQGRLSGLKTVHQNNYQQASTSLQEFTNKSFAGFEDPKNKPVYDPLIKQTIESFHPAFRNDPLMPILAKALVMAQVASTLYQNAVKGNGATTQQQTNTQQRKATNNGGPTAGEISGGGATSTNGKKDVEVTLDDFESVKRGF